MSLRNNQGRPEQQLSLLDATSIIVGIVIGVGIYETTPIIAKSVTTPEWLVLVWFAGGLLSLIGALCYAELATTYPEEGGDYIYLCNAWGPRMGFLFAWAGFWMIRPANIGAIAFIFAHYAQQIVSLGSNGIMIYAIAVVIILTLANISGVKSGKRVQNFFTLAKILGLLLVITIGLLFSVPEPTTITLTENSADNNLYLAMILVLFTYGGWSNLSYVAGEVIHPEKNILRSLITGTILITAIYIVINLAFLKVLGIDGMSNSDAIASDMMYLILGETGALLISILICITCLSSINGMIFTEARIYYALGRKHRLYRILGTWDKKLDAPVWSLVFQAIITLILIILLGTNENAFERLVVFSAPLHWFFFMMVSLALFRFRQAHAKIPRGFKVPLYPWLPVIFSLSAFFMLYASTAYVFEQQYTEAWWIIIIMITGLFISFYDPVISED